MRCGLTHLPEFAFVILAVIAIPGRAGAQDVRGADLRRLTMPAAQVTAPPAGDPHAFTAAPMPSLDGGRVDPADRAGGAFDAGPFNATPFSGVLSTELSGTDVARALDQSRPNNDPVAVSQSPE